MVMALVRRQRAVYPVGLVLIFPMKNLNYVQPHHHLHRHHPKLIVAPKAKLQTNEQIIQISIMNYFFLSSRFDYVCLQ